MPEAKAEVRAGMTWRGILGQWQLDRLKDLFGDEIVCPGYTGKFGNLADAEGRVFLPGAAQGINHAKRIMLGWKERGKSDEKYNWWPREIQERGYEAITGRDVIDGVNIDRWKAYTRQYRARVDARLKRAAKERKRKRAVEEAEEERARAATPAEQQDQGSVDGAQQDVHAQASASTSLSPLDTTPFENKQRLVSDGERAAELAALDSLAAAGDSQAGLSGL